MGLRVIDNIAVLNSKDVEIFDVQSAMDLIMNVKYKTLCDKIAVNKEAVTEDFFVLSNGLAGEILQKFINYRIKFAIFGDYSKYTSKPLKDFIYESNKGNSIFFVKDENEAIEKLSKA